MYESLLTAVIFLNLYNLIPSELILPKKHTMLRQDTHSPQSHTASVNVSQSQVSR